MKKLIIIILLAALILTSIPNDALALRPIAYQVSLRSDAGEATSFGLDEGLLELDRMIRENLDEARALGKQTLIIAIEGRPGVGSSYIAKRIKELGIAGILPDDISYIERDKQMTILGDGGDAWSDIFLSSSAFRTSPGLVLLEGFGVSTFCRMFDNLISGDKKPDIFMNIIADEDSRRYYLSQKRISMKAQLERFAMQQDDYGFDMVIDNSLSASDKERLADTLSLLKQKHEERNKNKDHGFIYRVKSAIWKTTFVLEVLMKFDVILPLIFTFKGKGIVNMMKRFVSIAEAILSCIKDSTSDRKIKNNINENLAHIAYAVLEWEIDLFPEGPAPAILSANATEEQMIDLLAKDRAVLLFIAADQGEKFVRMLELMAEQGHDVSEIYRFYIDDYLSAENKADHFIHNIGRYFSQNATGRGTGPALMPNAVLDDLITRTFNAPETGTAGAAAPAADRRSDYNITLLNRLRCAA